MALCLDQLLNNKKSSPFTLINSSTRFSALPLLAEFSTRALEDDNGLIVIVTETSPKAWFDRICTAKAKNAFVIDAYTDPFGWDDANDAFTVVQESLPVHVVRNLQDMEHAILAPVIQKTQNGSSFTIVIDSLHPLLMISPHRTYQLVKALESLTTDETRLIVGYRSDTRIPLQQTSISTIPMTDALNRLASVIITLEALPERSVFDRQSALTGFVPQESFSYMTTTSNDIEKGALARIEWRRKSGKVQYETNGFYLGSKGGLIAVPASELTGQDSSNKAAVSMDEDSRPDLPTDPMANLSFNLSLTETQRQAKENVVLPYMKVQQQQGNDIPDTQKTPGGGGGGHIYYEPDAADDFDDEDPDDDLDI